MSITLPRPPRGIDYPKDPCRWATDLENWARVAGGLIEDESRLNGAAGSSSGLFQFGPGLGVDTGTKPPTIDVATPYLPLTGGSLSGPLLLAANPTAALGAVTKQYVDGRAPLGGPYLPLAGGTLTGSITVNGPGCFVSSGSNPFALYATSTASYCPQLVLLNTAADTSPPYLILQKGRAGNTTTLSGDSLGTLAFQGFGSANGNANGALISAVSIGAAGTNVIPSVLTFTTAAASGLFERMRIDQNGNVGIGTGAPSYMLHVKGAAVAEIRVESTSYSKISFNATSSAANSGRWQLYGGANALFLDALNDAENSATPVMQVFRSGQAVTAVAFPSGVFSINNSLYFTGVTSGVGPRLYADATNFIAAMGSGNGGFYVQDSGGNNRAVIDQTGRIGLTHGGLGGTTGSQIMALRSFQTDGNNDAMEFLWNRTGPTTGWGNVDFIIRRNVDNTNAQTSIVFGGNPAGPVFTVYNQGAWRYSIDMTNQAWVLPASGGSYYWYSSAGANIMQLTNAGALTISSSISSSTVTGASVVATSGFIFSDRTGGTQWQWYGTSNIARLYNAGDKFSIDTAGNLIASGQITASGTLLVTSTGGSGQLRMAPNASATGYGSFWRNDSATTYLLLTNNNDAFGAWNGLRPFAVDNASGNVSMSHQVTIGGPLVCNQMLTVGNNYPVYGKDTSGTAHAMMNMNTDNNIWINDGSGRWVYFNGGGIAPVASNANSCGSGSNYWYQVWTGSGGYQTGSDRRLKTDIEDLPDCLYLVRRLAPQRFRWRDGPDTSRTHYGFVAQDVGEALGDDFGGYTPAEPDNARSIAGLNYNELTAVLWKACQELAARVETLEARA